MCAAWAKLLRAAVEVKCPTSAGCCGSKGRSLLPASPAQSPTDDHFLSHPSPVLMPPPCPVFCSSATRCAKSACRRPCCSWRSTGETGHVQADARCAAMLGVLWMRATVLTAAAGAERMGRVGGYCACMPPAALLQLCCSQCCDQP